MAIARRDQRDSGPPAEPAQPAQRALMAAGYRRRAQLTVVSGAEIRQLHGIGPKALEQLRRALHANGLAFADEEHLRRSR